MLDSVLTFEILATSAIIVATFGEDAHFAACKTICLCWLIFYRFFIPVQLYAAPPFFQRPNPNDAMDGCRHWFAIKDFAAARWNAEALKI